MVERLTGVYAKKVSVPDAEMRQLNARLERSKTLPKYQIKIRPMHPRGR